MPLILSVFCCIFGTDDGQNKHFELFFPLRVFFFTKEQNTAKIITMSKITTVERKNTTTMGKNKQTHKQAHMIAIVTNKIK